MTRLAMAKDAMARVTEEAAEIDVPVTVCVVDAWGELVAFERMDDAIPVSVEMAQRKAVTAALLGMTTDELRDRVQPGEPLYGLALAAGGKFVALGGGAPLMQESRLVGAIGVSGGTMEQDVKLAQAAADVVSAPAA